jgi:ectoine hydroxylase-related dioxygenase (phytanoyl-CoA dioxygenase family)
MLKKVDHANLPFRGLAPRGSRALEKDGHFLLKGAFSSRKINALKNEIASVYCSTPADMRPGRTSPENADMFRYQMFNRSPLCQQAIGNRAILKTLEPLLGGDCHVINCTAWRNPPGSDHAPNGQEWHVDGGPHVPRPAGIPWPHNIPFPIFVVATHIYLEDCRPEDGPTAMVPGSHTSGRTPPLKHLWDLDLVYLGRSSVAHEARAGDVSFFVSDVWHRRRPPGSEATGRFFLQTNYARRDIAQRILPPDEVNHTTAESRSRARSKRERDLIGLHEPMFYDG